MLAAEVAQVVLELELCQSIEGNSTIPVVIGNGGSGQVNSGSASSFGPISSAIPLMAVLEHLGKELAVRIWRRLAKGGANGGGENNPPVSPVQGYDGGDGSPGGGGSEVAATQVNYKSGSAVLNQERSQVGLADLMVNRNSTIILVDMHPAGGPPSGSAQAGRWFAGGGGAGTWNPSYGNPDGTGIGGGYIGPDGTLDGPAPDPVSVPGQGGHPYSGGGRGAYGTADTATAGATNTGGGGGGGGDGVTQAKGGNGGSGIVIVSTIYDL